MGQKVEVPSGVIDGVNAVFTTSAAYQPGSLSVWLNGQQILGGFTETTPASGVFTITVADCIPKTGGWGADTLAVDYNDTTTDPEVLVVDELSGTILDAQGIDGLLADEASIAAEIGDMPAGIDAIVVDQELILSTVGEDPTAISGIVEGC